MGFWELLLTAVALSMDAFAVSICKGLSACRVNSKHMVVTGLWFGGFQALMPLIGYFLGSTFERYITPVDHWIAFALLGLLGANMIKESFSKEVQTASINPHLLHWINTWRTSPFTKAENRLLLKKVNELKKIHKSDMKSKMLLSSMTTAIESSIYTSKA